jgi:hypothetical protein
MEKSRTVARRVDAVNFRFYKRFAAARYAVEGVYPTRLGVGYVAY